MHLSIDRSNTRGIDSVTYRFTLQLLATPEELILLERYAQPEDKKGQLKQYLAGMKSDEYTKLEHAQQFLDIHINNARIFVSIARGGEAFTGNQQIEL